MLVEDRHSISVLTEQILYPRIRAFDEDEIAQLVKTVLQRTIDNLKGQKR